MIAVNSLGWFILGATWVVVVWIAWTFMKASTRRTGDRMSDEWLQKKRREEER